MTKNVPEEILNRALEYIDAVKSGKREDILPLMGPKNGRISPKTPEIYQQTICSFDFSKRTGPVARGHDFQFTGHEEKSDERGDWIYLKYSARGEGGGYTLLLGLLELEPGKWYICDVAENETSWF